MEVVCVCLLEILLELTINNRSHACGKCPLFLERVIYAMSYIHISPVAKLV